MPFRADFGGESVNLAKFTAKIHTKSQIYELNLKQKVKKFTQNPNSSQNFAVKFRGHLANNFQKFYTFSKFFPKFKLKLAK